VDADGRPPKSAAQIKEKPQVKASIVALAEQPHNEIDRPRQKKCPDCAELILAEARVCKHCGRTFGFKIDPVRLLVILILLAFVAPALFLGVMGLIAVFTE
jgi:hypothetical protein